MSQALLRAVANCGRCIQYEAKGQLPPMQPIYLHRADGIGPHRLRRNGSHRSNRQEARSAEHIGGRRPLYPLCAGIRYEEPYGEDNGPGAVQQLLLCVWFSPMPHVGSGKGILWEGHCGYVQPAGCRKDPYHPVSPANQREQLREYTRLYSA